MQDQTLPEVAPATSPAPAFPGVPAPLADALAARGFAALTTVQTAVLAPEAAGRDLQISSQTGSGKTVALGFVLAPALDAGDDAAGPAGPRALILVPTRELAMQVRGELAWLYGALPGVVVDCVTGGTSAWHERGRLARGPRVVVGTPGRVLDHVRSGALALAGVVELVLDEADQMLDMGFRDDLEAILAAAAGERRTHLVSATFPPGIVGLATRYQRDPLRVEGERAGEANADIAHVAHLVDRDTRYAALVNVLLMAGDERALVFVNTRVDTARVAEQLTADGIPALPLSGELAQSERTRTLHAFRAGTVGVLVATDVASRGLDVPEVGLVVHAAPAMDAEVYVHRSGRTGRAGRKGRSVLLAPVAKERRLARLLRDAGIEADWRPAPAAEAVRRVLRKRARRALLATVDGYAAAGPPESAGESGDERADLARLLLADREPEHVVAALLARIEPAAMAAPKDVVDVPSRMRRDGRRGRDDARRGRDASDARGGGAARSVLHAVAAQHAGDGERPRRTPRPPGDRRAGGPPRAGEGYDRFTINWGYAAGANPERILAHVCRRGGVTSQAVGAIRLQATSSTFEIRRQAAGAFEERARRRDARDPQLVVRRLTG